MTEPHGDASPSGGGRVVAGRYRLVRQRGSGSMGTVWEAHDTVLNRTVAIKEVVLPAGTSDADWQVVHERTLREARTIAGLAHPNIITVYDVVEDDGRPWVVLELVQARSLADVIRMQGPLPPRRLATIGLAVLSALETVHQAGITHRDVKPGNILLTDDGRVKLTDFGIARGAGDSTLTGAGMLVGSPSYVPPEVVRGGTAGPPADLWGLGATLYAAAVGRPPFDHGDPMATLTAVVRDPTPPLGPAGAVGPVIAGLLEKNPAKRMTAIEARRGLLGIVRAFSDDQPAAAQPSASEPPRPAPVYVRPSPRPAYAEAGTGEDRRPSRTAAALLIVLALLAGTGVGVYWLTGKVTGGSESPAAQPIDVPPTDVTKTSEANKPPKPDKSTEPSKPSPTKKPSPKPEAEIPAGFVEYADDRGFTVAAPEGWQATSVRSAVIDVSEPGGERFLRLITGDKPASTLVNGFEAAEQSFSDTHDNYRRIALEPTSYRGLKAAVWEFTYDKAGVTRHVSWLNFVDGDETYGLYLSTPQSQWDDSKPILDTAAKSFTKA